MLRTSLVLLSVIIIAGASLAYYRYTLGVIEPGEIYPEALGQTREQIERRLGKPRRLLDLENGLTNATWQGIEPFSWWYSVWYRNDVAVHVFIPNDLVGLDFHAIADRVGPTTDWQSASVTYDYQSYPAWFNEDRSIVIFETALDYHVANSDSIFWE